MIRDVPYERRMAAARDVCLREPDARVRDRVLALAMDPGDLSARVRV